MIRVNEIKFHLGEPLTREAVLHKLATKLKISENQINTYRIYRESIDARKDIVFSYSIDVDVKHPEKLLKKGYKNAPEPFQSIEIQMDLKNKNWHSCEQQPIVIGFGPSGIFAGLQLSRAGLNPLILEMGEEVDERTLSVEKFWSQGDLDIKSNVQFGEGGAGTFSDGKLTTRIKDPRIEMVLSELVKHGAPEEIIYKNKPHIGTDILKEVVKGLRNEIISLGGKILFNTQVTDLVVDDARGMVNGVRCENGKMYASNHIIIAVGHSARPFYEMLLSKNVSMEQKPFAVGLRIEHPQKIINASQYGAQHAHPALGAAEYKLTYRTKDNRSVYSFCMCPGGEVVGSASEPEKLVVNGMSFHSRSLANANSAILVNVTPEDLDDDSVLAGLEFQRHLEAKAFELGGKNYAAPVQTVGGFTGQSKNQEDNARYYSAFGINYDSIFDQMQPTYRPSVKAVDLHELLPSFIYRAIEEALNDFGKKIKGFDDPRAILTGVESRSSAPVRIIRDPETYQSISMRGLYPIGEGAGYAGGITSSAVDGIKGAEKVILNLLNK